jgi:hypothetical protein
MFVASTCSFADNDISIYMQDISIYMNDHLNSGPSYVYTIYRDPILFPESPKLNLSEFECKGLSCFGNKSGSDSTSPKSSQESVTRNTTAKVRNAASPNSSTYEIILTNRNKSASVNVSGWEIVATSVFGNEKSLRVSNDTSISPEGSLAINSPFVDEPLGSIILRDATGSIIGKNSTIPINIQWQKTNWK